MSNGAVNKFRISANVKSFEKAVTVRDVCPIFLNRSIEMRLLILFGPGDIRSQESKHAYFICYSIGWLRVKVMGSALSAKTFYTKVPADGIIVTNSSHMFLVTAADFESLSPNSKAALFTVITLHRVVQPKPRLTSPGFDPKY